MSGKFLSGKSLSNVVVATAATNAALAAHLAAGGNSGLAIVAGTAAAAGIAVDYATQDRSTRDEKKK